MLRTFEGVSSNSFSTCALEKNGHDSRMVSRHLASLGWYNADKF
jgi:hypothetical protein